MKLYLTLKFDREIDSKKHYISPGGYEIACKDGRNIAFDFERYEGTIASKDHTVLGTMQKFLDTSAFPKAIELNDAFKNDQFDKFVEFFIHTGEYDDPEIRLEEVQVVCFELDDGNFYNLSKDQIRQVNELIKSDQ